MAENRFNWKIQGTFLKSVLELKFPAVAISFGKEPMSDLQKLAGKMEFCRMWAEAQKGKSFFATPENHNCLTGTYHLGIRNETVRKDVCRFWVEQVYAYSSGAVKKYVTALPHLNRKLASLICLAPLEEATFQPDLILVRCTPEQAMLLLWSYSYNTGEVVQGETGTAMCQTLIVKPLLQDKPSFSIGDPGGTYGVGLSSGELMVSLPYPLLAKMTKTLQQYIKYWKTEI
ncbi:MAG: DUF169 domain-containing protein [Candidatus Bathyarchaeia archaeon]